MKIFKFTKSDLDMNNITPEISSKDEEGIRISGMRQLPRFPLPDNFKLIMPPNLFQYEMIATGMVAGTFEKDGKKVGLLRIPTYAPRLPYETINLSLLTLRYYINKLEKETDYLILDQTL
jgi:hypothetical protein